MNTAFIAETCLILKSAQFHQGSLICQEAPKYTDGLLALYLYVRVYIDDLFFKVLHTLQTENRPNNSITG